MGGVHHCRVTKELLEDAPALGAWLRHALEDAERDHAVLVVARMADQAHPTLFGYPIVEHEPCDDPTCVLCAMQGDIVFGKPDA